MHLSPEEMRFHSCCCITPAFWLRKRLARGLRFESSESVRLIAAQVLEFIRDGRSVAETLEIGRQLPATAK